jgi:hypothetical protein
MEMLTEENDRSNNIFFKEAMMVGCWSIWNQRNNIIFENDQRDIENCFASFKLSIAQVRHRVKPSLTEACRTG